MKPRRSVIDQLGIVDNQPRGLYQMIEITQEPVVAIATAPAPDISQQEDRLVVFTDGACSCNGSRHARAGYAVVWPNRRSLDTCKRLTGLEQTNNRAEFMALLEAQKIADRIDPSRERPLYVYTDSELLINSVTKWLPGWKRNDWKKSNRKPVLNQDLLKGIDANPRPLIFKHVRAHTGRRDWESMYNEEADRLARSTISQ
jgi:ribonuclease HI